MKQNSETISKKKRPDEKIIEKKRRSRRSPVIVAKADFHVVAIGASVGGLQAISELLKHLPANTGMAYIYVQHLNPDHKSLLADLLAKTTQMKVQEIDEMELIRPDNVYIMPNDKIIEVIDGHIALLPRPKNGPAVSIDVLFESLALTHLDKVIGVVLTGNGRDGTNGLAVIKSKGGITMAQDGSAEAGSMPQSAIAAGVVDFILSPKEMAHKLARFSNHGFALPPGRKKNATSSSPGNDDDIKLILSLLYSKTGVDFGHYKMATVRRRLSHKMEQRSVPSIKAYLAFLEKNPDEIDQLYASLLINVTSFFRDAEVFDYLKKNVFPQLLLEKKPGQAIRIWVPACSSGQEAYSIAMIFAELQAKTAKKNPVHIFATDLSDQAIREARNGKYSSEMMKSVSTKRIASFFMKEGTDYRVVKEIRDMCVFATHNILRDPPFSKIDFISCCNLLIYFDNPAHRKIFHMLHFALNEIGVLMIGKAESASLAPHFFSQMNNHYKIYSRKKNAGQVRLPDMVQHFPRTLHPGKNSVKDETQFTPGSFNLDEALNVVLLRDHMPACAIINKEMEILEFRGPAFQYLCHYSGKANLNILKMARPEFVFELRNAITLVLKTKETICKSDIEIEIDSVFRLLSITVSLLKTDVREPYLLIVFTLGEKVERTASDPFKQGNAGQKDRRIKKLADDLDSARAEMTSMMEAHESMQSELQAANEEIISTNEEFQTLNEELETSKEEIQASNEELLSTNHELQTRNDLLTESYEFSESIIATCHEQMLVLNKDFRIKMANRSFYKKFKVKQEDTEGKLLFELNNNLWDIGTLRELLTDIIAHGRGFENFEVSHVFPDGEKIMRLNANLIVQKIHHEQLILLAIDDVTERSRLLLREKNSLRLIEASLDPLITIDNDGKITDINLAMVNITGLSREKLKGASLVDYFTEPERAYVIFMEIFSKGTLTNSSLVLRHKSGKLIDVLFNGSIYKDDAGKMLGAVIVARDVTEQKKTDIKLLEAKTKAELAVKFAENEKAKSEDARQIAENAMKSKQQFLSNMSHEIRTPLSAIIGFTKVMLKTDLDKTQQEYLSAIKTSGDALIVIINDILDLAKVDAGKMTFEQVPFKLSESIATMITLFERSATEKNIALVKEYDANIPDIIVGDPARLHQIILNLLSNAVKFTHKGKITVGARLIYENAQKVTIEFKVSDTGIGIAPANAKRMFESFEQASTGTARTFGGTGLGLAIAKQMVELQNGTIKVQSKINEGSVFAFELCFQKVNKLEAQQVETPIPEIKIKALKVLVVEDVQLNQLLIKIILQDFGFECETAANGKIAIEMLQKKAYDIILMDLQMPEMNGFETAEYIRKTLHSNIPIIALTADVTTADKEQCKLTGMNDCVLKPIDEKVLHRKIVEAINSPGTIDTMVAAN
jgi:two-component system, chemotaxis family, CheB/CheR fusion protein